MQSLIGRCFCKEVRFEIFPPLSAPPTHRLQTHTVVIDRCQLRAVEGELHTLSWGDGATWQECARCRSRLFFTPAPGSEIYVEMRAVRGLFGNMNLVLPDWLPCGPEPDKQVSQFYLAARKGQWARMRRLLERGVAVDCEVYGETALEIASQNGWVRICRLLLSYGADVRRALRHAWNHIPMDRIRPLFRLLLAHGYPAQDLLIPAIASGSRAALLLVLKERVDLDQCDRQGRTLLEQASHSPAMLRALLRQGVDVTMPGSEGWHALDICAYHGMTASVRALLQGGFPPDLACDGVPGGALRVACSRGHVGSVRLLLDFGANPNRSHQGQTPLMLACAQGSLAAVELLLAAGADPSAKDRSGLTAVEYARRYLPDLLESALQRASQLTGDEPIRHRWIRNSHGEPRLKVRKGERSRSWTNCHAAIVARLEQTATPAIPEIKPRMAHFPLEGGCKCGGLRFRLHAGNDENPVPPILFSTPMVGVPECRLEILSGPDSLYIVCPDKPTSRWWRCRKCRQNEVIFQTPEAPGYRYLRLSHLDDPEGARELHRASPQLLYLTAPLSRHQQTLHRAARLGDISRVGRLINHGWPVDTEIDGWTPLQKASNAGYLRTARLLLKHGADVHKATVHSGHSAEVEEAQWLRTLLHYGYPAQKMLPTTVLSGSPKGVRILLRAGADINLPDDDGDHPLLHAAHNSCAMIRTVMAAGADPTLLSNELHALGFCAAFGLSGRARVLLKAGFPVNLCERDGRSCLCSACGHGMLRTARVLLEHGADVNLAYRGFTPLMTAATRGSLPLVDLLLEFGADHRLRDDRGNTALDYVETHGNGDREAVRERLAALGD